MTQDHKQLIELASVYFANKLKADNKHVTFYDIYEAGATHILDHPSDFNLVSTESFSKEPVTALLVNALKYCNPEQLIALRNALNERTDKMFSREEVVGLLGKFGYEASQRGVANGFDEQSANEWLDNHTKK